MPLCLDGISVLDLLTSTTTCSTSTWMLKLASEEFTIDIVSNAPLPILEGEVAPVDCTAEDYLPGACARDSVCMSRSIWERVQAAILGVLDSTTLDDLLISDALQHAAAQFVPLDSLGATHLPHKGEFAHA